MRSSAEGLVTRLFAPPPPPSAGATAPAGRGLLPRRGGFRGVALQFTAQLDELLRLVGRSQPHFIRCVKPNGEKLPRRFERPVVLRQLRCGGVLEAVRVFASGYPDRVPTRDFVGRYCSVPSAPPHARPEAWAEGGGGEAGGGGGEAGSGGEAGWQ